MEPQAFRTVEVFLGRNSTENSWVEIDGYKVKDCYSVEIKGEVGTLTEVTLKLRGVKAHVRAAAGTLVKEVPALQPLTRKTCALCDMRATLAESIAAIEREELEGTA
jgi:hypothetical protein